MNQLEKDRLIEKFMGWELKWEESVPKMYSGWCFVNKHTGKTIPGMYNNSELPYCTDWNWLMEALHSFDNIIISEENMFNFYRYRDICDQIDYAVTLYNIDDAVNALCEGIEWYNSTLNLKNK